MSEDAQLWFWSEWWVSDLPFCHKELQNQKEYVEPLDWGIGHSKGLRSLREEKPKDELQIHPSFLPGFTFQTATKERNQSSSQGEGNRSRMSTAQLAVVWARVPRMTELPGKSPETYRGVSLSPCLNTKLKWCRACPGLEQVLEGCGINGNSRRCLVWGGIRVPTSQSRQTVQNSSGTQLLEYLGEELFQPQSEESSVTALKKTPNKPGKDAIDPLVNKLPTRTNFNIL